MLCQKWGKYLINESLDENNEDNIVEKLKKKTKNVRQNSTPLIVLYPSTCTELQHQPCNLQWKCLFDVSADGNGDNDEDNDGDGDDDNNGDDGDEGYGDGDGDDDDQEGDGKKS